MRDRHRAGAARMPVPQVEVRLKRIDRPAEPSDGARILVDRLWPRGISRRRAALDDWMPDLAPSTALSAWLGQDPSRWEEFRHRYRAELRSRRPSIEALRRLAIAKRVTLLHAARDPVHNDVEMLRQHVEELK